MHNTFTHLVPFFVMPPRVKNPKATTAVITDAVITDAVITDAVIAVAPIAAKKRSRKSNTHAQLPATEVTATEVTATELTATELTATELTPDVDENKKAAKTKSTESVLPITKKRGRKPKGGKLIQNLTHTNEIVTSVPNIIVHLKCGAADIDSDNFKPGDVVSFNVMDPKGSDLHDSYHSEMMTLETIPKSNNAALVGNNAYNYLNVVGSDDDCDDSGNSTTKNIMKKLNHLKMSFHMSDLFQTIGAAPRRSCCFWDTCEFDTPPVYLPKCISNNGGYVVYACFCSPECALAYLMDERIDTSVKFERCQMLNAMHGKINVSIKPAPNPQYMLSKFYGNLTIQEYRKLFKSEQIVYVVNKPLTHILPEIYEENNDFMLNNKIIPTNNYKLKKRTNGVASVNAFG